MILQLHLSGNLDKYINMKFAYLSESAIVLLILFFIFEFVRQYRKERAQKRSGAHTHDGEQGHSEGHAHGFDGEHSHSHHDGHAHAHGHSHHESRLKRALTYSILIFPIATGIFLPVQTLDSSFVKAKGFSFPSLDVSSDNPGFHQFLKPDTSVFYGKANYRKVSQQELSGFTGKQQVSLNDTDYLTGLEAIYNYPDDFMGRTLGFDGFIYKGEQVDNDHYFVFRFGFIHCVADSGVFGMLVEFPKGTVLKDDTWVHVSGTLTSELYQPFKQTIPVLKTTAWKEIAAPSDPYVYRTF